MVTPELSSMADALKAKILCKVTGGLFLLFFCRSAYDKIHK
ncbi:hypothetical protein [Methanoregula sp.]